MESEDKSSIFDPPFCLVLSTLTVSMKKDKYRLTHRRSFLSNLDALHAVLASFQWGKKKKAN